MPCRLLSVGEIAPVQSLLGKGGPPDLLAIMSVHSDYLCIDMDVVGNGRIVYCAIETFPDEVLGVCDSLWELLALLLNGGGGIGLSRHY